MASLTSLVLLFFRFLALILLFSKDNRVLAAQIEELDTGISFGEELFIRPLRNGHTSTSFLFSSHWEPTDENRCGSHEKKFLETIGDLESKSQLIETKTLCHFGIFPRAIGEIIDRFQVEEMELRFTRGRWELSEWGPDPLVSGAGGPSGAELWAHFFFAEGEPSETVAWERWGGLTKALGGLFCASLETLDHTRCFEPGLAHFGKAAGFPSNTSKFATNGTSGHRGIIHGVLPREAICTENLTPWTKLLPCRDMAGLSTLLRPTRIFASDFHSLSISISVDRDLNSTDIKSILLEQKLTAVFPPGKKPNQLSLFSLLAHASNKESSMNARSSSTATNLPQTLTSCPLAKTSAVHTIIPKWMTREEEEDSQPIHQFHAPPTTTQPVSSGWHPELDHPDLAVQIATHDIPPQSTPGFKVKSSWLKWSTPPNLTSASADSREALVFIERYVSGQGGMTAQLNTKFTNNAPCPVLIQYSDAMPQFVLPFFNTISFQMYTNHTFMDYKPDWLTLAPRESPHLSFMEMAFQVPPRSSILMSLEVTKKFLHVDEFPPDASRGLDLHPGIASFVLQCKEISQPKIKNPENERNSLWKYFRATNSVRLYSEACLTYLPEPDFSMPFNVITLNCTLIALFIGTMLNLLVRKSDIINPVNRPNKLKEKIRSASFKLRKASFKLKKALRAHV